MIDVGGDSVSIVHCGGLVQCWLRVCCITLEIPCAHCMLISSSLHGSVWHAFMSFGSIVAITPSNAGSGDG